MAALLPTRSAHREAIGKEKGILVPRTPVLALRGYLCVRCLRHVEKLNACAGCKRVFYCSKTCQSMDWKIIHKSICNGLRRQNEVQACVRPAASYKEYANTLASIAIPLRNLEAVELTDVLQGQPYCSRCYRTAAQATPSTALVRCSKCNIVTTCKTCTPRHTTQQCQQYQDFAEQELFLIDNFESNGKAETYFPTEKPRTTYMPLSSTDGWCDYYTKLSDKQMVRQMVKDDFTLRPEIADDSVRLFYQALRDATELLTMPLTILAALEERFSDLTKMNQINLHLLGANARESHHLMLFEEILHLLPSLSELHITLVGPMIARDRPDGVIENNVDLGCCPPCVSQGRKRSVSIYKGAYHEYAKSLGFMKPDMAVLFHSGRSQEAIESWKPTTRYLVDSGITTLCTTFNETEMREETEELRSRQAKFLVEGEVNKWRSINARPDFLEEIEHSVFHQNSYRYVFKGRG